ncbi:MAG: FixH family protein [Planctomycetes bacterium]|nr:FixH family protein [Planctomycetota bacterium]
MTFRWWMAPVIGVGLVAVANGVLIFTAVKVRPQKSEARPYAASAEEDIRTAERAAFRERGWRIDAAVREGDLTLTLRLPSGAQPPLAGLVRLFRPDDVGSDRAEAWSDPSKPLSCKLPRAGAWTVQVELRDAAGVTLVDSQRIQRP